MTPNTVKMEELPGFCFVSSLSCASLIVWVLADATVDVPGFIYVRYVLRLGNEVISNDFTC